MLARANKRPDWSKDRAQKRPDNNSPEVCKHSMLKEGAVFGIAHSVMIILKVIN